MGPVAPNQGGSGPGDTQSTTDRPPAAGNAAPPPSSAARPSGAAALYAAVRGIPFPAFANGRPSGPAPAAAAPGRLQPAVVDYAPGGGGIGPTMLLLIAGTAVLGLLLLAGTVGVKPRVETSGGPDDADPIRP